MRNWTDSRIFWKTSISFGFFIAILWAVSPELWRSPLLLVKDDARHFVIWLRQMADPSLFPNDPMAAYWQALTPDLYKILFLPTKLFSVDVVMWHFLFVAPLACVLLVISAHRLVSFLLADPVHAGFATLFLCYALSSTIHGLPRSFGYSIVFFALSAFLERKIWLLIISLFLGAAMYPAAAVVACSTIALFGLLTIFDERSVSWEKLKYILAAGTAGIAGIASFLLRASGTGPTMTLAEAKLLPIFSTYGRARFFRETLLAQIFSDSRGGMLPLTLKGEGVAGPLLSVGMTIAVILLGVYAYRRTTRDANPDLRKNALYLMIALLVSGLVLFALAYAVAFRAHLPQRYAGLTIALAYHFSKIVIVIAIFTEFSKFFQSKINDAARSLGLIAFCTAALVLLVVHAHEQATTMKDYEPKVSEYLRQTPADTLVAGLGHYVDCIPAFANRSVYVSMELLVPYKRNYYNLMAERFKVMRDLYRMPLGPDFAAAVERIGIDFFILPRDKQLISRKWFVSFPFLSDIAENNVFSQNRQATEACTVFRGNAYDLVSADCMKNLALKGAQSVQ